MKRHRGRRHRSRTSSPWVDPGTDHRGLLRAEGAGGHEPQHDQRARRRSTGQGPAPGLRARSALGDRQLDDKAGTSSRSFLDERPSPRAAPRAAARWPARARRPVRSAGPPRAKRSKIRARGGRAAMPGPASSTTIAQPVRPGATTRTADAPAAVGLGVPDQVRDDPFEAALVDLHRQRRRRLGPPAATRRAASAARPHEVADADRLPSTWSGRRRRGRSPAGRRRAAEPFQLVREQLDRLAHRLRQLVAAVLDHLHRVEHRRHRRAQLVADVDREPGVGHDRVAARSARGLVERRRPSSRGPGRCRRLQARVEAAPRPRRPPPGSARPAGAAPAGSRTGRRPARSAR